MQMEGGPRRSVNSDRSSLQFAETPDAQRPLLNLRPAARSVNRSLFVTLGLSKSVWLLAVNAIGSDPTIKYRMTLGDAAALTFR
jgi:hypothetical protein